MIDRMSKNIRVGYSGLIFFGSRILSMFTGLVFITLVTRNLPPSDFGLWQLILSVIGYAALPNVIVGYWVIRDLARGEKNATAALLFSILLSAGGMALYILISLFSAPRSGGQFFFFTIAIAQVPLSYIVAILSGISQATRPQSVGVAFIVFESVKVIVAIIAFFRFDITLNVAIIAILFALIAQCVTLFVTQPRTVYTRSINWQTIKKWIKLAWLPLFITFSYYIGTFDNLLVSVVTGSTLPLADYRVSHVLSALVTQAEAFGFALYPKLIGGGPLTDSRYVIKLIMLFGIPMSVGLFILAVPLLSILGTSYIDAYIVLWPSIPVALIALVHGVFESILTARERVDTNNVIRFKDYMKSRLFTVPEITLFASLVYLIAVGVTSYWLMLNKESHVTIATAWSFIALFVSVPGLFIKWRMMKRSNTTFSFPWKNIGIYALASSAMAVTLIIAGAHQNLTVIDNNNHKPTLEAILRVVAYTLLGAAIYVPIVFSLDKEFRVMFYKSFSIVIKTSKKTE
jgi:O-antigen/teichoic acid export membrane protein